MNSPLVTVGVPVYNGEATFCDCLDSLLNQTYQNLEIIVSDNMSSDSTPALCRRYLGNDSRVTYVRQEKNIGAASNFAFVLERATGKYFMWAACDDIRSPNFVEENVKFLEGNPEIVATSSPNCFAGEDSDPQKRIDFDLTGTVAERFSSFFDNAWKSHGVFYSLVRTHILKECPFLGFSYIAVDWAIDLFLLTRGEFHRVPTGLVIFGANGESSREGGLLYFRRRRWEYFFPFVDFSRSAWTLASTFPLSGKVVIAKKIVFLNLVTFFRQLTYLMYSFYKRYFRKYLRRT